VDIRSRSDEGLSPPADPGSKILGLNASHTEHVLKDLDRHFRIHRFGVGDQPVHIEDHAIPFAHACRLEKQIEKTLMIASAIIFATFLSVAHL
jgi:hypothetical protein